jgi:hypothetical protein
MKKGNSPSAPGKMCSLRSPFYRQTYRKSGYDYRCRYTSNRHYAHGELAEPSPRMKVESLPINSRSPLDLIFTLPGVTEEALTTRDLAEDRNTSPPNTPE